jgi:hypothetical protein
MYYRRGEREINCLFSLASFVNGNGILEFAEDN